MWPLFGPSRLMNMDETLPVLREGGWILVGGKRVPRETTRYAARGMVAPLTGRDLLILPEGDRNTEQYQFFQVWEAQVPKLEVGDKLLRGGKLLICESAKDWGSFVEARLVVQDVQQDDLPDFGDVPQGQGEVPVDPC